MGGGGGGLEGAQTGPLINVVEVNVIKTKPETKIIFILFYFYVNRLIISILMILEKFL